MYFDELQLTDNVLDALYDMHFETCTPVQERCIPEILAGRDVLGVAQTGTGKTAAYLLPILSKLDGGTYPKDTINCVVMSPTRELAQQIDQAMQGFAYYLDGVSSLAIYGGNDGNRYDQELRSLQLGADVIIATPGRLLSHISMGNADFSRVSFFVLDEADRMLDMGFSDDIMKIARLLPATCQTVMFSATMPDKIEELARTLLKNPVEVKIAVSKPADKIRQSAYVCHEEQKLGIIKHLFKQGDLRRVIIFSGKKQKVKAINRALLQMKINSGEMHSDLDQTQRNEMLHSFKSGQIDVLVATDIVARGIDIDDVAMVVNYDVPRDAEDYVHRIGRTARADHDGVAVTFISKDDIVYFKQIERLLEKEVTKNALPDGLGEGPEYASQRRRNGGQRGSRGGQGRQRGGRGGRDNVARQRRNAATTEAVSDRKEGATVAAETAPVASEGLLAATPATKTKRRRSRRGNRSQRTAAASAIKTGDNDAHGSEQRGADEQRKMQRQHATSSEKQNETNRKHRNRSRNRKSPSAASSIATAASPAASKPSVAALSPKQSTETTKQAAGTSSIWKKSLRWLKSLGKQS